MRIVAGSLGGRRLSAPRDDATRPTADRVREALFSILGPLAGARGLDLYAGTGALGLEALSRGASSVAFVESRRAALDALRQNILSLGVTERTLVVARPVERAVAALSAAAPFDLAFADPPYAALSTGEAAHALGAILGPPILSPGARVIVEHASSSSPPGWASLELCETRRYGDTSLSFYEVAAS